MKRLFLTILLAAVGMAGCGNDDAPPADAGSPENARAVPARPPWPPIEEGRRLVGEPLTRNYYVVFDASGSMSESRCADGERSKISAAKKAIVAFAGSLPADANVGLLSFDAGGMHERLPLTPSGQADIRRVVSAIGPGGVTPLRSAIARAYAAITEQAKNQLGYGEYHLVVVTDGEFNPEGENPADVVARILAESPVVIHTIGFCIGDKHSLNQVGRTFYKAANNPDELKQGLDNVLAESPNFDIKKFQ
jgi:Ca-activated chloride channel homolog